MTSAHLRPTRAEYVAECLALIDTWYRWGGKDPRSGLDCSGLVTYSLGYLGGPDVRSTHNTTMLWMVCPKTERPRKGDLAEYDGHVAVLVEQRRDGLWVVVTAAGGGPDCTTKQIADKRGARVRVRKSHLYRADFRAFRSMEQFLSD